MKEIHMSNVTDFNELLYCCERGMSRVKTTVLSVWALHSSVSGYVTGRPGKESDLTGHFTCLVRNYAACLPLKFPSARPIISLSGAQ